MGVVYNSFMNTRVLLRIWDDLLILAIYIRWIINIFETSRFFNEAF